MPSTAAGEPRPAHTSDPGLAPGPPRPTARVAADPGGDAGGAAAIEVSGLTKHFGARAAVDGLTFAIPRGIVCGLVGPNGSGKTTTIRMLIGLATPTAGTATVLGCPVSRPAAYLPRVGALIEGPAFYPTLSGRRNLRVLATLGGIEARRVDEVLEIVGLRDRAGDPVRAYSLGMKQRLGIAAALLPRPDLLILDEPANGLDPAGILEMRRLLRSLSADGVTVFISSHILSEVEQMSDWVVVMLDGRLVAAGPVESVLAARRSAIVVAAGGEGWNATVAAVARGLGFAAAPSGDRLRIDAPPDAAAALNRAAMEAGVVLTHIGVERPSLETAFLEITGGVSR